MGRGGEVSYLTHKLTLTNRAEDYYTALNKRPKIRVVFDPLPIWNPGMRHLFRRFRQSLLRGWAKEDRQCSLLPMVWRTVCPESSPVPGEGLERDWEDHGTGHGLELGKDPQ